MCASCSPVSQYWISTCSITIHSRRRGKTASACNFCTSSTPVPGWSVNAQSYYLNDRQCRWYALTKLWTMEWHRGIPLREASIINTELCLPYALNRHDFQECHVVWYCTCWCGTDSYWPLTSVLCVKPVALVYISPSLFWLRQMIHPTVTHPQIWNTVTKHIHTHLKIYLYTYSHWHVMKYIDKNQINYLFKHKHIYIYTYTYSIH